MTMWEWYTADDSHDDYLPCSEPVFELIHTDWISCLTQSSPLTGNRFSIMKFSWTKPWQWDPLTGVPDHTHRESSTQSCYGNHFCKAASTHIAFSLETALPALPAVLGPLAADVDEKSWPLWWGMKQLTTKQTFWMMLVLIILCIVTLCITIVRLYFLLSAEDYRRQWTSFLSAVQDILLLWLHGYVQHSTGNHVWCR